MLSDRQYTYIQSSTSLWIGKIECQSPLYLFWLVMLCTFLNEPFNQLKTRLYSPALTGNDFKIKKQTWLLLWTYTNKIVLTFQLYKHKINLARGKQCKLIGRPAKNLQQHAYSVLVFFLTNRAAKKLLCFQECLPHTLSATRYFWRITVMQFIWSTYLIYYLLYTKQLDPPHFVSRDISSSIRK